MTRSILNCAVIGLGVGEQHALAFERHGSSELLYICDFDQQKAKDFKEKYKLDKCELKSFDAIVADKDIDLISIASFDDAHYQQVLQSLQNDKHVFVEKPMCQTLDELNSLFELWGQKKLGLSSNLILRVSPLFQWLFERIQSGDLGEIYAFDGDYLYGRIHKIIDGWRANIDHYSIMEGGGIHLIDLMTMLTGQKPVRVHSVANKIATREKPFRYHDFHHSTFYFESGLVGRITANFGCVHRHQHVIRVFGTKGTFIYDDMGARIHWHRSEDSKAEHIHIQPKPDYKGALIPQFIDVIVNGRSISHDAQKEFNLMSMVLCADKALQYEQPIMIEYLS